MTRDSFSGTAANAARFAALLFPHASLQNEDVLGNTCKLGREILEMLCPSGQEQRATSRPYRAHDVASDHFVPRRVVDQRGVDVLDRNLSEFRRHPEFRVV